MELVPFTDSKTGPLRSRAKEVSFPLSAEIKKIIADMRKFIDTLASPYGKPAGLAAPQVGHAHRIIMFQLPPEAKQVRRDVYDIIPLTVLLNPSYEIYAEADKKKDWEACYSVPEKMGEVYRYNEIKFQGWTEDGEKVERQARGFLARVIQHEVAHLNGELYIDLLESDCRFGTQAEMWPIRKAELGR